MVFLMPTPQCGFCQYLPLFLLQIADILVHTILYNCSL